MVYLQKKRISWLLSFLLLFAALGMLLPADAANAAAPPAETRMITSTNSTVKDVAAALLKDFNTKSVNTKAITIFAEVLAQTPLRKTPSSSGTVIRQLYRGTVLGFFYETGNFYRVITEAGTYGYVDKTQAGLFDEYGNIFSYAVGECTAAQTYVYETTSTTSTKLFPLSDNDRTTAFLYADGYYLVSVAEEIGSARSSYMIILKSPTINDANVVWASGQATELTYVYKSASTTSTKLLRLDPGDYVDILRVTPGFYKVWASGKIGYVPRSKVSVNDGLTNPGAQEYKTINTAGQAKSACKIYKSMSTSSTVLKSLSTGATFTVLSVSGSFFKVKSGTVTGYIPTQYVKVLNGRTICAVGEAKNQCCVYASTSTSSTVQLTLETYALVALHSVTGSFYKVTVSGVTGYIPTKDIRVL